MHHTSQVRWIVLYVILAAAVAVATPLAAATAGGTVSDNTPPQLAAAAAQTFCRISIKGDAAGKISTASISCQGAPAAWMFSTTLLGPFKGAFQGITLNPECASPLGKMSCLLGVCNSTGVVQIQAVIEGVHGVQNILCVAGNSRVHLQSSLVANNTARAVLIAGTGDTHVTTNASRIVGNIPGNTVWPGAGMVVMGNATVVVLNSSITGNIASRAGGGLAISYGAPQVTLIASCICENVVRGGAVGEGLGGGVYMTDNASLTVTYGSRVANNYALPGQGGGVYLYANARLLVSHGSAIAHNRAVGSAGGGVSARGNASVTLENNSTIAGNVAVNATGGGVSLTDATVFSMSGGSSITDNRALNASGGGMAVVGDARVTITGANRIVYNHAINWGGGGVYVAGQANVSLGAGTLLAGNTATDRSIESIALGGGLAVTDSAFVALTGADVTGNSAPGAGGLVAAGTATVVLMSSRVTRNNATENGGRGGGGGLAVVMDATVTVTGGSTIADNTAFGGGGAFLMQNGSLVITDGSVVRQNEAREGAIGGGLYAADDSVVYIGEGVQFLDNKVPGLRAGAAGQDIVIRDRVRLHVDDSAVGGSGPLTKCSATVYMATYICGVGEYLTNGYCACCPVHTYSYANMHRNMQCEKCPEFAFCPGADKILPLAGYWHSSPQSTQMHQCPLQTLACGEQGVCQKGYQGNLCGACAPGYGMRQALRCGQCMSPQQQLGIYLTLSCLTVLFITLTVHLTWRDNQQQGAQLRASDLIKVLVLYLQYMVIIGSISAPFPDALRGVFDATSVVFGAASGQVLSLDCVLAHYVPASTLPLAIQRQLVNVIAPVVVFGLVMLLLLALSGGGTFYRKLCLRFRVRRGRVVLQSGGRRFSVLRHWPMVAIIVVFYAYPTLVKASLSFFACLPIDDASGPSAEYAMRNHNAGYWVYDGLNQECFLGWHKAWALALGLPAVLVFCLLLPVGIFFFLWSNRSRVAHAAFREQYGFLYRIYADNRVWWEPIWMAQTVLLSTVAVFHFSIQAYYSVLILGGLFVGSAVLQAFAKPYAEHKLHLLQLAAMACLYSTSYCTLALFTVYGYHASSAAAAVAISVLMIASNCAFILWSMYAVVSAAVGRPVGLAAVQKVATCCTAHRPCGCARAVVQLPSGSAQLSC